MSPRRRLDPVNPSAGMLEELVPGIVRRVDRAEGRYSVQYSNDGMIDSNMPGDLLERYTPPVYSTYDPIEVRLEIGSGLGKFEWEKGIVVMPDSHNLQYTVLLLNGDLKKDVNWSMLRAYNPRVYGEGDAIVHRTTGVEGMVLNPCLGKPHRYDLVMRGGKVEKCVNWNMIKSFEPPIYLEGDLVTYQYKPAIIQKAYLRDDTYSLRYEGEEDHTVGSSHVESKQNVSKFVEKIKWVYLQKRTGVSLGMNNKQGSEVLGRLVVGDAVEFGCRGSRKAGVVIKKNYDENVDEVVDGKILYDIEGEDGVIHKDVSSRHIRRFEPTKFKINDTVLVEKEDVRLAGQVDYEEGVVVKIHAQENTYDVKIIEAEFVAQWSQGVEYRQTQWGRKASPFDKKTNTSASSANFSISLFDDSFSSSLAKSPLPLTLPSSSLLPTSPDSSIPGELPSGSLLATSPAVATSPLPSSLSLGDMHEFSMASSCIPSMDQDKILKIFAAIPMRQTRPNKAL